MLDFVCNREATAVLADLVHHLASGQRNSSRQFEFNGFSRKCFLMLSETWRVRNHSKNTLESGNHFSCVPLTWEKPDQPIGPTDRGSADVGFSVGRSHCLGGVGAGPWLCSERGVSSSPSGKCATMGMTWCVLWIVFLGWGRRKRTRRHVWLVELSLKVFVAHGEESSENSWNFNCCIIFVLLIIFLVDKTTFAHFEVTKVFMGGLLDDFKTDLANHFSKALSRREEKIGLW